MERISVIIPVFNRSVIFRKSLDSVVHQIYRPLQVIVVDDGSEEDVESITLQYAKKFMRDDCEIVYYRQENKGAPAARNVGFERATGDYAIFWDADVIGEKHMLERMSRELLLHRDVSFVYSNFFFGAKHIRSKIFSVEDLRKENYITTTSLVRTADVIPWDESLKRFQDWDFWLTLAEKRKKGAWIDETLFYVSTHGGTMSSWLPRIAYHPPLRWFPYISSRVRRYEDARKIIFEKHNIT